MNRREIICGAAATIATAVMPTIVAHSIEVAGFPLSQCPGDLLYSEWMAGTRLWEMGWDFTPSQHQRLLAIEEELFSRDDPHT